MTTFYDVFNGDADGICALHQLRLTDPRASVLVTGAKRDITLLDRVEACRGDRVTVLDISLARNAAALERLLERGASCRYFDHHFAGEIPRHPELETCIDTASDVCTSLLVDRYLKGSRRIWAVVAAFGDNLAAPARDAASALNLNELQLAQLQSLGECINYNAYGASVDDLMYHPADLYESISHYEDPFQFISGEPIHEVLRAARADDLYRAGEIKPTLATDQSAIYVLPDSAWSRRVNGAFINQLATVHPQRAHAVLVAAAKGYHVSVRSPLENAQGADALCREFGGNGRHAAAGIDALHADDYERFVAAFGNAFDQI
ncbi:MAG: Acetyltransferase [Betaproteobacteria bacterium]|nr:Acetyltransferase [Betaproteobacteria bacterium]